MDASHRGSAATAFQRTYEIGKNVNTKPTVNQDKGDTLRQGRREAHLNSADKGIHKSED